MDGPKGVSNISGLSVVNGRVSSDGRANGLLRGGIEACSVRRVGEGVGCLVALCALET